MKLPASRAYGGWLALARILTGAIWLIHGVPKFLNSAQFMPLLIEIYRDAKAIFKANPVDVFAKGTGGEEFSYVRGRGLEQAIEDMGEVLHAQYTITYSPNNADEPGFHQIAVDVIDPNAHSVRSRPGYWLGAK